MQDLHMLATVAKFAIVENWYVRQTATSSFTSMGPDPVKSRIKDLKSRGFCAKFAQNSFGGSVAWISR